MRAEDPFVELLNHEVGKLQTTRALMRSNTPNRVEHAYDSTLKVFAEYIEVNQIKYQGKKFRKVIQEWSQILFKDGRRKIIFCRGEVGEGRASVDFAKAIINAFKRLNK